MKKNIAAIAIHLVLILLLNIVVGAFSGTKETEGSVKFTGELERNVTIRILENDTAVKQGYMKRLLDAFNEAYAEYGIVAVDANMDEYSDLENDGPYGYGPDVLYQANDRLMRYVDGKHIQPIPVEQLDCYNQVGANAWSAYESEFGGETYTFGVPVNVQGPLLYYRKDLLPDNWQEEWEDDKNGVPDMVENWNDMYKFSMERRDLSNEKFGYMKSLFDPYFAVGYLYSYGAYSFGNNNRDPMDIGYSKGNAELGAGVIRQLAGCMNEWCIDDTITVGVAKGNSSCIATGNREIALVYKVLHSDGFVHDGNIGGYAGLCSDFGAVLKYKWIICSLEVGAMHYLTEFVVQSLCRV